MPTAYQPRKPVTSLDATFWTYQDAVEWLLDFYGRSSTRARDTRLARLAVDAAYRELVANKSWGYYRTTYTLLTDAQYTTGTVAYTHSTRTVTLTDGTWPANAAYGMVRFNDVTCRVQSRTSDTEIVLVQDNNPGVDVAAGTTFQWYRDAYYLPLDFLKLTDPLDEDSGWGIPGLTYVQPEDLHRYQRVDAPIASTEPHMYTVDAAPQSTGYVVKFATAPATARNYSFVYDRTPRRLSVESYSTGTLSVSEDSVTVTGSGTSWTDKHVGCVLRVSENSDDAPTNAYGDLDGTYNPAWATRLVASVASGTSLAADVAFDSAKSGVNYVLSDPLDIDIDVCGTYFQRLCQYHYAVASNDHLQKGYKLPQTEKERRQAMAMDANRTIDIQPPPWASRLPSVMYASIETDMDA